MLEAHELHNLVAEDVGPWGNPYDAMLECATKTNILLERLVISSEAQRERPRPTIVPLSTVPFSTTLNYRVIELVLSCTGAATVGLVVGSSTQVSFIFSQADSKRFPYPTLLARGVDLSLVTTAGAVTGYIVGYPE
jgi:hypothetical protein